MGHVVILLHVLALAAGLYSALSIQAVSRRSNAIFLRPYFLFVLFLMLVVFLRLGSRYILINLMGAPLVDQPLFVLLVTPLRVMVEAGMVLFFLKTLWSIRGSSIPTPLGRALVGISAAFVLVYGYVLSDLEPASSADRLMLLNRVFDVAVLLAILGPAAYMLVDRLQSPAAQGREATISFAVFYLAGFGLFPTLVQLSAPAAQASIAGGYIAVSLYPVLWLWLAFPRSRMSILPEPRESEGLDRLAGLYGLTDREKEIVGLVLEGQSNREIAHKLFISGHTVRNHLHHVFTKAEVRSRGQLISRVLETLKAP